MRVPTSLRAVGMAALAAMAVVTVSPAPTSAAALTPAQRVVAIVESQLGKPYRFGAEGPGSFDCSGLVLFAFDRAGLAGRVGGGHSALGMWRWFAARGLASRTSPQVGDLVVYGRGGHVGIYVGHGRVVSALTNGVRATGVYALHSGFTTFLHTRLSRPAGSTVRAIPAARSTTRATTTRARTAARARIVTSALRLRSGASLASPAVALLLPGTRLTVLGAVRKGSRLWYHVRGGGRLGWVAGAYTRAA